MSADQTRKAILDATEELLAHEGFAAMSLRALTSTAGVNLAAVHYHFGSKEEVTKSALARRIAPINEQRLQQLDELEAAGQPPALREVLRTFLAPVLMLAQTDDGSRACRMFGRLLAEHPSFLRPWLTEHFRPVLQRFGQAFAQTKPDLPTSEILWRLHFVVGAMTHTLLHAELLHAVTEGMCEADEDGPLEQLLTFCANGFAAAPAAPRSTGGDTSS